MKKNITVFSFIFLIIGLACFSFAIYIGYEPIFEGHGYLWEDFYNIIKPVSFVPAVITILLVLINIGLTTAYFCKKKSLFIKVVLKNVFVVSIGAILFLLSAVLISILRESARRTNCRSNIYGIGLAIRMYSNDYHEQFPNLDGIKGLELLRKLGYLNDPHYYVCPSSGTILGKPGEALTEGTVDYIYRGGHNERDNIDIGIVCDKQHDHYRHGNILFIDNHIGRYFGDDWQDNMNPISINQPNR